MAVGEIDTVGIIERLAAVVERIEELRKTREVNRAASDYLIAAKANICSAQYELHRAAERRP